MKDKTTAADEGLPLNVRELFALQIGGRLDTLSRINSLRTTAIN